MKRFVLTTASAALLASAAALSAQTYTSDDLSTMTCTDFRALGDAEQMEVAALAAMELEGGGESLEDSAQAADDTDTTVTSGDVDQPQDTTIVDNEGTATATDGTPQPADQTVMQERMEQVRLACDRNMDANILDAAAGIEVQR